MSNSHRRSLSNSRSNTSRSTFLSFAEKLSILHPQPSPRTSLQLSSTPRTSRDWSHENTRRTSIGLPTPASARSGDHGTKPKYSFKRGHRRQLSLSSFSPRAFLCVILLCLLVVTTGLWTLGWGGGVLGIGNWSGGRTSGDDGTTIPLGQSRQRGGREVFWWEQFERLNGYYGGWKGLVTDSGRISEQREKALKHGGEASAESVTRDVNPDRDETELKNRGKNNRPALVDVTHSTASEPCYIDKKREMFPPKVFAHHGLPQGFPEALFGSSDEIGLRDDVCYDRINRLGPYGFGFAEEEGGLGVKAEGDTEGLDSIQAVDYRHVLWSEAQEQCIKDKNKTDVRTAFIIRTWHTFEYTPYHIMMLRAIISELALTSGGLYTVHFLIHVQDDSIPIWASNQIYNEVLAASLPTEFRGMGTLWSAAQMKLIYPPPFAESIVNFSGDEIYKAYRSLHFPLQLFAEKHPEFEYFWHWEMDIRVTGGYLELFEQVTRWAEAQEHDLLWEKSSEFFIPSLFNHSYKEYRIDVQHRSAMTGQEPIAGPQLSESERLSIPGITDQSVPHKNVDLITFSPLFDPEHTRWAFHDDITGYPPKSRPPTRAALITASRLSRRLLITMHHETFAHKHTMFPEMFPASVALHYGYKAVYAPLPIYFDRDWPANHANEVFNNAVISEESRKAGMDHGAGHFHGEGGSVFGPGEHVFRGASWYANGGFAQYLWRRWLGRENGNGELEWEQEDSRGRMCLPMMVLHPIKHE